jgi:hypothetical protein
MKIEEGSSTIKTYLRRRLEEEILVQESSSGEDLQY